MLWFLIVNSVIFLFVIILLVLCSLLKEDRIKLDESSRKKRCNITILYEDESKEYIKRVSDKGCLECKNMLMRIRRRLHARKHMLSKSDVLLSVKKFKITKPYDSGTHKHEKSDVY